MKHIILLSTKSSGSSAFQEYVRINYGAQVLSYTPHHENETLFWTKAASILSLPQARMYRSVVPYTPEVALKALDDLLMRNGIKEDYTLDTEKNIIKAYKQLANTCSPFFFEKSPHHLYNWSNIQLLLRAIEQLKDDIDFHIVGLVRNPLDTIYSAWSRWKYIPFDFEKEWLQSYENLLRLKDNTQREVTIFNYEEIGLDNAKIDKFLTSIGCERKISVEPYAIHQHSISKWREDGLFGHKLSRRTIELALKLGYHREEVNNSSSLIWPFLNKAYAMKYYLKNGLR